jgi:biotin carboxyl carrier protein
LELEVGDRLRTVEIRRRADGFDVVVDGRARIVDVARVSPAGWSLLVRDTERGIQRSVEATVLQRRGDVGFDVQIDGVHIPIQLKGGLGRRTREIGTVGTGTGMQRVNAPMPGKIVRVLVAPGDAVKARQSLVVVEAMKMENELRAARDGRVRQVFVSEGQSVDAGAPLVVVE